MREKEHNYEFKFSFRYRNIFITGISCQADLSLIQAQDEANYTENRPRRNLKTLNFQGLKAEMTEGVSLYINFSKFQKKTYMQKFLPDALNLGKKRSIYMGGN